MHLCHTPMIVERRGYNIYLRLTTKVAYKNRSQQMKCQIVKDPLLRQIGNATKMTLMIQIKLYVPILHKITIFEESHDLD